MNICFNLVYTGNSTIYIDFESIRNVHHDIAIIFWAIEQTSTNVRESMS
jgi:hypothetical protein